ncbi:fibronectin type III domain-containing protein [Engelhardtia mirabilis]|uniref:Purple acid phosphatase N-terminal domain-containing protein n=1 Tax=Engelhardtia mirabilis TaxID=2528011 RepID=A0A518BKI1_9BACT|nr:hypothetical protein Pla133_25580 [Planctomycetes bacterium Pla133]QDV01801.1 hypothetical protein Pla86_25570 [Planctomycetes bacterium Pla86]
MIRILALLCVLSAPLPAQEPDPWLLNRITPLVGTQPAQWRVVWTENPATTATISWTTAEPGTRHRVLIRRADQVVAAPERIVEAQRNGPYAGSDAEDATPAHFHHARLTGLEPSTTYVFVIDSDGSTSRELHFQTAPADGRAFSLLVGGDSRSGLAMRCVMNSAIAHLADQDTRSWPSPTAATT